MFETPKEVKPDASKGLWIGITVVILLGAVGVYFFQAGRGDAKKSSVASGATAPVKGDSDPVRDLRIQRASMSKDRNGTMSVWSVSLENKSAGYRYSSIKYETTYIGGDGRVLMVNKGTFADNIAPGEEKSFQANDPLYPEGTARYNFKITGATPAAQ
jgi:hypothetical protein